MNIEDSIRDQIAYCEKKAREYTEEEKKATGGFTDLWRGKAETHKFIAIRLKKILEWHGIKP